MKKAPAIFSGAGILMSALGRKLSIGVDEKARISI
jgi:hypothetical protein